MNKKPKKKVLGDKEKIVRMKKERGVRKHIFKENHK